MFSFRLYWVDAKLNTVSELNEHIFDNLMKIIWKIHDDMMTYWMIDNSSKVGSCSLDGSYSRTVLYSPSYLRHPFSISVFEVLHLIHLYNHCNIYHWRSQDLMYWTEWDSHRIYEANKFNGANVTTVTTTSLVSKQTNNIKIKIIEHCLNYHHLQYWSNGIQQNYRLFFLTGPTLNLLCVGR